MSTMYIIIGFVLSVLRNNVGVHVSFQVAIVLPMIDLSKCMIRK